MGWKEQRVVISFGVVLASASVPGLVFGLLCERDGLIR